MRFHINGNSLISKTDDEHSNMLILVGRIRLTSVFILALCIPLLAGATGGAATSINKPSKDKSLSENNPNLSLAGTASVGGGGNGCSGNPTPNVTFTLTGTPPWTLTYCINGVPQPPVGGILFTPYVLVSPPVGTYTVCGIADALGPGTPIVGSVDVNVNPVPSGLVSGGGTACSPLPAPDVSFAFTGVGPWDFVYSIDGVNQPVVNTAVTPYNISSPGSGLYVLVSVDDADGCPGTTGGSANVVVNNPPTYSFSGGGYYCPGQPPPDVTLNLTGTPPWEIGLSPLGPTTVFSSPYVINNPVDGFYQLDSISDAICDGIVTPAGVVVGPHITPGVYVSGGGTACAGTAIPVQFDLTGVGPWDLFFNINGFPQNPELGINSTPFILPNATEGLYEVYQLSDDNCMGDTADFFGSAEVVIHDRPNATISGGGEICEGDSIPQIRIDLQGVAPWDIQYTIDGVPQAAIEDILTSPYIFTPLNGSYTLNSIQDLYCSATIIEGSVDMIIRPSAHTAPFIGPDAIYCQGDIKEPLEAAPLYGGEIQWYSDSTLRSIIGTGINFPPYDFVGTTEYFASEVIGLCKGPRSMVAINVIEKARVDAGGDIEIHVGQSIPLMGQVWGGQPPYSTPSWNPPFSLDNPTTLNPIAAPLETTAYTLTINDAGNCPAADTVVINVLQELVVPTGITPNGDGFNDTWIIENIEYYPNARVEVYGRWGNLLWASEDGYPTPWNGTHDGKVLPTGSQFYVIKLNDDYTPPITGSISIISN